MRTRALLVVAAAVASFIAVTTAASGAGPGPGIDQGTRGLARGNERYVAISAGSSTIVQAISRNDGTVKRFTTVAGTYGIPMVTYDGTTDGMLPDGRTITLAQPVFDGNALRKQTSFAFVDVRKMRRVNTITLKGAFSFDALSPNGRYMYLIEYVSSEDPTEYRVRAYDLKKGELLMKIVSDKRSWETTMHGSAITRTSKGGWAYTLYGAGPTRPFIHALDTRKVAAVCIDLPWKTSPQHIFDYRLRADGDGHLVVRGPRGRTLAVIDRHDFRVLRAVKIAP
jgi:hypothetical protein